MTMTSQSTGPKRKSTNRAVYWPKFVQNVHRVLSLGYQQLCKSMSVVTLASEEEPTITGFLVTCMREMKHLVDWRLAIEDDPPLNDDGRTGRRRARIDIQVTRLGRGVEPRFQFEAKRLYKAQSLDAYLKAEGLQAILTGYYATGDDHAGMLGYVQQGVPDEWAEKIRAKLDADHQGYGVAQAADCWQKRDDESKLEHSYFSHHANTTRPITVHHTLLMCHE